jgi:mono/diheme cytochrome c family protein
MLRSVSVLAFLLPLLLADLGVAVAQGRTASEPEKPGERLFSQSCVLCHKNPQVTGGQYAPVLSKDTLGGNADVIAEIIKNGSPHMPGFALQFTPAQIDAIVTYVKTLSPPASAAAPRKSGGPGEAD